MENGSKTTARRIAEVVHIYHVQEQPTDFAYWQSVPYEDRIRALEEIRREYHLWKYHAEPRLQRVYSIAQRQ